MIKQFIIFVSFNLLFIYTIHSQSDTLRIFYDIDQFELSDFQLRKIDSVLNKININELEEIKIFAFTDFLASNEYNLILAQKRANKIIDYLFKKSFTEFIDICKGIGELPPISGNQFVGIPLNRRSEIIFKFKNKVEVFKQNQQIENANVGEKIVLKNFNFLPGRHYLTSKSQPELENLLKIMLENPKLQIEIQGHICCEFEGKDGIDHDTQTNNLSENRAKYIYEYLVRNNISEERLKYKGFGSSRPLVYPELSEEDQNQNRRVEILILQK